MTEQLTLSLLILSCLDQRKMQTIKHLMRNKQNKNEKLVIFKETNVQKRSRRSLFQAYGIVNVEAWSYMYKSQAWLERWKKCSACRQQRTKPVMDSQMCASDFYFSALSCPGLPGWTGQNKPPYLSHVLPLKHQPTGCLGPPHPLKFKQNFRWWKTSIPS